MSDNNKPCGWHYEKVILDEDDGTFFEPIDISFVVPKIIKPILPYSIIVAIFRMEINGKLYEFEYYKGINENDEMFMFPFSRELIDKYGAKCEKCFDAVSCCALRQWPDLRKAISPDFDKKWVSEFGE